MESLVNLLGSNRGETIELVTHAGQKLSGIVDAAHEDFFTLIAITRMYFVPYTAVSTLVFPPERLKKKRQESPAYIEPPVKRSRRKTPVQKESAQTPAKE